MDFEPGRVAISRAGRDKGRFLAIMAVEEGRIIVCDGRERPLERPKKKNPKHLAPTSKSLAAEDLAGNRALRKALNRISKKTDDESSEEDAKGSF